MIVGVPRETAPGERRVALVPDLVAKLAKAGLEVVVQPGAGVPAGFPDTAYRDPGARLEENVFAQADILLKVQPPTVEECGTLKEGATLVGLLHPYTKAGHFQALAARKVTAFAMELMPRVTRAQPMDVLSA